MPPVTFFFDVGSPYAYLAAERAERVLPGPVHWQPVLLGGLFKLTGRSSWALGDYRRRQRGMAEIERRARGYGLPPIVWPDPWPSDYLAAMRLVTHAFRVGTGREVAARVFGVPTVAVGEELFWGDDRLEDAAASILSVGPAA